MKLTTIVIFLCFCSNAISQLKEPSVKLHLLFAYKENSVVLNIRTTSPVKLLNTNTNQFLCRSSSVQLIMEAVTDSGFINYFEDCTPSRISYKKDTIALKSQDSISFRFDLSRYTNFSKAQKVIRMKVKILYFINNRQVYIESSWLYYFPLSNKIVESD
jgi:hypothetical protein